MKKLLLLIIVIGLGLGGMYWYSQTEVVVDEPAPTVPSSEESTETSMPDEETASTESMQEKLVSGEVAVEDIFPEDFEPMAEPPAEVIAMMEKAEDPAMTEEELMAMEKEAIEAMNSPQETPSTEEPEMMTEEEMEKMAVSRQGAFSGADAFHQVSGTAIVIPAANTIRLENFNSTNGPDLRVSAITNSGQRVDLGALKGNVGNQNYSYAANLDPDDIASVEIWCRAFNVTFGTATLN